MLLLRHEQNAASHQRPPPSKAADCGDDRANDANRCEIGLRSRRATGRAGSNGKARDRRRGPRLLGGDRENQLARNMATRRRFATITRVRQSGLEAPLESAGGMAALILTHGNRQAALRVFRNPV
jgi:hypothetical protein